MESFIILLSILTARLLSESGLRKSGGSQQNCYLQRGTAQNICLQMVYNPIKEDRCGPRERSAAAQRQQREKCSHLQKTLLSLWFSFCFFRCQILTCRHDFYCVYIYFWVGVKRLGLVLHCNLISWRIWGKKAGFLQWVTEFEEAKSLCTRLPLDSVPGQWKKFFRGCATIHKLYVFSQKNQLYQRGLDPKQIVSHIVLKMRPEVETSLQRHQACVETTQLHDLPRWRWS